MILNMILNGYAVLWCPLAQNGGGRGGGGGGEAPCFLRLDGLAGILYALLCEVPLLQFREKDFQLRTETSYDETCERLEKGPTPNADSVKYGINYRSPLNKIMYFHVARSQIPQDIMHVLLEGVIPLETKLMLGVFIYEKKYFGLNFFNNRIASFSYGKSEARNKIPKPIERGHILSSASKLRLSGRWCSGIIG